jgi:YbbR domain-containing protein
MMPLRTIWPFRHFWLKLLSVGLAVSLWMLVAGEETVERGLRVPLELQQFPTGLELQGEPPASVDVRIRGGSGALSRVGAGDVVAVIDLHGARPGQRLFHLTPDQVRAPFGVEVVQVMPATIALGFEASKTARVPIVPEFDGRPAPGFVVGKYVVDPPSVEIIGPESAVERVTKALTEPVSVADARDAVRDVVTVGLLDSSVRVKSQRSATVTVQITPGPVERTLRAMPVHLRNPGAGLAAEVAPALVSVTLRGTREALNRVEADDVKVYVDVGGLGAGEYPLTVRADVAREAGVIRIDPPTVQVRISRVQN